jgi:glutamate dehydrogenase
VAIESMGGQRALRIAVINDDMPFLVDSIAATITAQGLTIERLLHPVVAVRRDPLGALVDLPAGEAIGELRESIIYLETERADAKARRELAAALAATLADVHAAVADWPQMQGLMQHDARACPIRKAPRCCAGWPTACSRNWAT